MTIAKVQHYVPQFLLRNFGNGKKDQVWVYDKSSGRSFPSNVKNVASESRFYNFEHAGQTLSLEPWLCELEGKAKSVISSVLDADSLSALAGGQRQILASFLAVQMIRTKNFREEWSSFPGMLRERLQRDGDQVPAGSQAEEIFREISENDLKEQTARMIFNAPDTYAAHFLEKDWVLAATQRKHPFLLSDNPLTRQNMLEQPNRGNLGLASPGIEIYFPLSPTRALAMWCPTLSELVHRAAHSPRGRQTRGDPSDAESISALSKALRNGKLIQYSVANVENFNSLQVAWSERYIFSTLNDFQLASEMLEFQPRLRGGPRPTIS